MNDLVKKIAVQVYGSEPLHIEQIKGKGKNNLVFKIGLTDRNLILRLSSFEGAFELYKKEKSCAEVVEKCGILTPKIFETGEMNGYAYSFQEFIEGVQGMEKPEEFSKIWSTLGQYASVINKISAPEFAVNYKEVTSDLFADDYFIKRHIFSKDVSDKIRHRLEETTSWDFSPSLCHGNLHPSNVILSEKGIYLIDWETASGNKTPEAELSEIYTWNTGKENIAHFLTGYGLDDKGVVDMMRDIQTLILLRLIVVIVRKINKSQNEEWKQDKYIQETALMIASIDDYAVDILFTKNLV